MNKKARTLFLFALLMIGLNTESDNSCSILSNTLFAANSATVLWSRGYALLPEPQKISLRGGDFSFDGDWTLELLPGVAEDHLAVRTLVRRLKQEFGILLSASKGGSSEGEKVIQLEIRPGSLARQLKEELSRQAYILEITPRKIKITANDQPGLLYGVSTLLQLLVSKGKNNPTLPVCRIEDWPELELREIHWDSQYHQDRFETLKEYLDRAVEFKINAVGFSLKDKFAYQRHPIIAAPGAFTREQLQELVRYAQERFIELTPMIQVPSHMSYVLKHPQFAHLREDINNNFQICTSKEESWKLIFDMFDEILEATAGCRFFHVGTDESWFYGTGKDCACAEKVKKIGKSGMFVEFMLRASEYLQQRGREVRFWGEFPLEIHDLKKLPNTLIDAVAGGNPEEIAIEKEMGMRIMIYTSVGSRMFFPRYFREGRGPGEQNSGNLEKVLKETASGPGRKGLVLGTFSAAWDESDPHNEVFWLTWVATSSYGWHAGTPALDDLLQKFMVLFYGPESRNMLEAYHLMNDCCTFWTSSWEKVPSLRGLNYGGSYGPRPSPLYESAIELPNLPDPETLYNHPFWKDRYRRMPYFRNRYPNEPDSLDIYHFLSKERASIERLIDILEDNYHRASRNRYNIEVMLSIANYWRHNINLFQTLAQIEDTLSAASRARSYHRYQEAISHLESAERLAEGICGEREELYRELVRVWEKSRYPKGMSVGGKKYVHIESNTWSGRANRTPDLSFIVKRERDLNLEKWLYDLKGIRHTFALKHQFEIPEYFMKTN